MNIFEWAAYQAGRMRAVYRKAQYTDLPYWLKETADVERSRMPNLAVQQNQADLYTKLSWVSIAVQHVARQAAGVTLNVKKAMGEEIEDVQNHDFEMLMKRPNPSQSRVEFLEAFFSYYKLTGNSYAWMNKANENSPPTEMWTIPSYRVRPVPDGNMYLRGYMYDPGDGQEIPLETWEVFHMKTFNPMDRFIGLSPIEALAQIAVGDLAMQKWNTNYFDKNNAKLPGILTFSDPVDDATWAEMKDEFADQYGGSKRQLLMLRNTGPGAVNWVATAMSQSDMQFLDGRQFNKEEIFAMFAPGLASWLDVNSTEANSKTGKDAFLELAVWPMHTALAEKITNDILPVYGDEYFCEFDDVRPMDRNLKLQEQAAYERTHTVEETRKEFYGDMPLGDERDMELVGETKMPNFMQEPQPNEAKSHEREQFRAYAKKRVNEGKIDELYKFKFNHLDIAEQEAVKAEFIPYGEKYLADKLMEAIDIVRGD